MNKTHPVLCCEHLKKTYIDGKLNVPVLNDVNLSVHPGDMIAIVGASGSGKSTLLHLLGGLEKQTSGDIFIADNNIEKLSDKKLSQLRNQYLGFIYQFHHLLPEFNALENTAMPLLITGVNKKGAFEKAEELLNAVGLANRMHHRVSQISGGERQRIAIARALVNNPVCVLADEPTGNLDQTTAKSIYNLLLNLNETFNTAFIIVTHNIALAEKTTCIKTLENGVLK